MQINTSKFSGATQGKDSLPSAGTRLCYLSIEAVMIEHVVVTELILVVELGISETSIQRLYSRHPDKRLMQQLSVSSL